LYRIAISREVKNLSGQYELFGITANGAVVFLEPNVDYNHYLIKKIQL